MRSPIEKLFEEAFERMCERECLDWRLVPEEEIGGYRVDFLLLADDRDMQVSTQIVVECDGFDFHERTAQQASHDRARDRALLRLGFPTVRYLGADIHHGAECCALDLVETARSMLQRMGQASPRRRDARREKKREENANEYRARRDAVLRLSREQDYVTLARAAIEIGCSPSALRPLFRGLVLDGLLVDVVGGRYYDADRCEPVPEVS
jgi:very-short-patch-repair endonuclease